MAPSGYSALYHAGAFLHIDPLLLSKLLPIFLGLISTGFAFGLSIQVLRSPVAALITSVLLNQSVWMQDDLISATPRAFIYPLTLGFLYFLCRRAWLPCVIFLALQGLFYPSALLISSVVLLLSLVEFKDRRLQSERNRSTYLICFLGLGVAAIVLIIYAAKSAGFGPVVTSTEGSLMPEFWSNGRMRVFHEAFWEYWVSGQNTGIAPASSFLPVTICSGILFPVLILFRKTFSAARKVRNAGILGRFALASVLLFCAAHLLLFRLYLPNRYTQHSLRILLCVCAGPSLIIAIDTLVRKVRTRIDSGLIRSAILLAASLVVLITLIIYLGRPARFMQTNYRVGRQPQLYEFLSQQPKNVVVASLSREADRIPVFARRTNLVSWEYCIPFHKGYYGEMRQRALDLIRAQYTPELEVLRAFITKYSIDFIVVDRAAFEPNYLRADKWFRLYETESTQAARALETGAVPALEKLTDHCAALRTDDIVVIPAACVLESGPENFQVNGKLN